MIKYEVGRKKKLTSELHFNREVRLKTILKYICLLLGSIPPITKIHSSIFTVPGARQLQLMSERVLPELQQHPPAFLQLQV